MNNRQASRRRGRGNNRAQQGNRGGGFDYQNRVDNRARGNASQMLEKYKKLANDAQMNGDRVTAEYYFQFADHYFRVLADFRARQEARQDDRRGRERDEPDFEMDAEEGVGADSDADEGGAEESTADEGENEDFGVRAVQADDGFPDEPARPAAREPRREREPRKSRESRDAGDKPRQPRRRRAASDEAAQDLTDQGRLDGSILPPSISLSVAEAEEKPVRKPRARRPRQDNDVENIDAAE